MRVNNVTPTMNQNMYKAPKASNVAFSGKMSGLGKSFKDIFSLQRAGNMSRELFTLNAFAFLLGGRLVTSRDKNEIRETATRDIPTILIAVFGVPAIGNKLAEVMHNNSGFAICASEPKKTLKEFFSGEAGSKTKMTPVSYEKLSDWYKFDDKLAGGFEKFAQRLQDCGGNMKKICSSLDKEMKSKLSGFSEVNAKFMDELNKTEHSALKADIEKAFKCDKNGALRQAKWLKTIPALAGFVMTLGLIGMMIPKLNIAITESINKKKQAAPASTSGDTVALSTDKTNKADKTV